MTNESPEDLQDFLSKVDDIHRIVQDLSSDDKTNVSKAMQESDQMLKEISKTGVDRTVINKTSSESKEQIAPNAFMYAMEKDAQERTENRRKQKILADQCKTKGNEAFHQQLYDQAIEHYTEGLKCKKDYDILYTNRAQVYAKQGRYEEAINDCDWALKVTSTFLKAYIIKGKCYIHLKAFDRAREEFLQAEQVALANFESLATRRMIEECLEDVQRQREKNQREEAARKFLSAEDSNIPMNLTNTLEKLKNEKQTTMYYIGGIDLLCQLIVDEITRTAFRVNNGFDLFNSHAMISESTDDGLSDAVFNLMILLCQDDDENTKQCLESKYLIEYLIRKKYSPIVLKYLVDISLKTPARILLIQKSIPDRFIPSLINLIDKNQSTQIYAAKLLSNLSIEIKIKQYFTRPDELSKLISILKSSSIDEETRTTLLSLLTNLCSEKTIRSCALDQTNIFPILIIELKRSDQERQANLLGLLINLTNEPSVPLEGIYKQLCESILTQLNTSPYQQRILTLLGNLAMHYSQAVDVCLQYNIVSWTSQAFEQNASEEQIRAGVRLLALCTQSSAQAQQTVANHPKLLSVIYEQFSKSRHSLLIGNASLVLSHVISHPSARTCLQQSPGIEKTIDQMLKLVEESWLSKAARKNVAIFITKLVKADEKFLEEFRKQHGTEILHSALKDVEL